MEKLKTMKENLSALVQTALMDASNVDAHELGEVVDMLKDVEESMFYAAQTKKIEEECKEKEEQKKMRHEGQGQSSGPERHYYTEMYYPYPYYFDPTQAMPYERDMDRTMGRMYYTERQPRNEQGQFTDGRGRRNYYDGGMMYYGGGNGSSGNSSSSGGGGGGRGGSSGGQGGNGGSRGYWEREVPFDLRDTREGRSPMTRRNYMESKEMHKDKDHQVKELEKYMQELSEDIVEMIEDASPEEKQILEKKMTNLASKVAQLNRNA